MTINAGSASIFAPGAAPTERNPLSSTQELFLTLEKGDTSGGYGSRFVLVDGWRIAGPVDLRALHGALDDVVNRHEILRSIVVRDASPPYQEVRPALPVSLEIVDLPGGDARSREEAVEDFLAEAEARPFHVSDLPLLRATLGRFDAEDSVLALETQHSATDAWSIQLIMRDLAECYARRTGRLRTPVPPPAPQYSEFAKWERAWLNSPASEGAKAYWRENLRDAHILALPTDRPVGERPNRPYSEYNFLINPEVMRAATALARNTRTTLFMVLAAAFSIQVCWGSGTSELTLETITSGRSKLQFQDTIGPFLNILPIRMSFTGCRNFREALARTKACFIEAYRHELPFVHIVQEAPRLMDSLNDPYASPFAFGMVQPEVFKSTLQLAEGSSEVRRRVRSHEVTSDIPNGVLWTADLLPSGELLTGVIFNLDHFNEHSIAQRAADYHNILSASVNAPDQDWSK
jgi:condensation enzyme